MTEGGCGVGSRNGIQAQVVDYWTKRSEDFLQIRRNELADEAAGRWRAALLRDLPPAPCRVLDAGTGAGFFAVLLAAEGYRVTGIDLTPSMLENAEKLAAQCRCSAEFLCMDAGRLAFPDASFDAVISRNLTWTLPDVRAAYREWLRVLKPGGILLNFDACYGKGREQNSRDRSAAIPYGHQGMTADLEIENQRITKSMPVYQEERPDWDTAVLESLGASVRRVDREAGKDILRTWDLAEAPLFSILAEKTAMRKETDRQGKS